MVREPVRVDAALLAAAPDALWLEPVAGDRRLAHLADFERRAGGDVVWRGRFAEDDPGYASVTLSRVDGELLGRIELPEGPTWLLRPRAGGGSWLSRDASGDFECGVGREGTAFEADGGTDEAEAAADEAPAADRVAAAADEEREVHLLVVYTPSAAARQGGREIELLAAHHVDVLNTAFANSRIDGRALLAAAVEADLGIEGTLEDGGAALRHSIGHPVIRELQDRYRADLVSVVVDDSTEAASVCGFANAMFRGLRGPQMANQAYNVIGDGCFGASWTFVHQAGHLFGAQHDPRSAGTPFQAAYPFAFAHGVDGAFRTLMADGTACEDCSAANLFSNPLVSLGGVPAGVPDERDNALTIDLTFPLVASFRSGRPPPPRSPAAPAPGSSEHRGSGVAYNAPRLAVTSP